MKPENPHPLSTGYAEAQRVGWQEGCDAGYKAGKQAAISRCGERSLCFLSTYPELYMAFTKAEWDEIKKDLGVE